MDLSQLSLLNSLTHKVNNLYLYEAFKNFEDPELKMERLVFNELPIKFNQIAEMDLIEIEAPEFDLNFEEVLPSSGKLNGNSTPWNVKEFTLKFNNLYVSFTDSD